MSSFTRKSSRPILAIALALSTLAAVSGCGAFDLPQARPCAWLDGASGDPGQDGPRTVVLVDRSPSTRPGKTPALGKRVPDWAGTLLASQQLAPSQIEGGLLSLAGFDGTRATVDWEVDRASVAAVKGNDTLKKDRWDARRRCLDERLRQLSTRTPGTVATDVLGALSAGADQLGSGPGRRRILLATDGLANTGCTDLRSAGFDGSAEITETVRRCRDEGELPDLKGAEVSLVGIGHVAQGASPSSPQTAWLTSLWTKLCQASGASECKVTAAARTRRADSGGAMAKGEPEVRFPAVSERPAGRITTLTLPGSVLFATDRAELTSQARGTLDAAARRIEQLSPLSVAVSGHTDSRGTEQRGRELSRARAEAVRAALVQRGITVASARGYSDGRPRCTPEYRHGTPDYAAMACNRRVEIAVSVRR